MKLLVLIFFLFSAFTLQPGWAKDKLGKYQKLSRQLSTLCNSQITEKELIRAIRTTGGLRSSKRPTFVKTNSINFPQQVRLRILKDGNWDLTTEEPSDDMLFKVEHYVPTRNFQMFTFANAKQIDPSAITKADRPTIVVFTPSKVLVVATEYKHFYLLDRPDLEFARIKYRKQIE